MPCYAECPYCGQTALFQADRDPSDLSFGGMPSKCSICFRSVRLISFREMHYEQLVGAASAAGTCVVIGAAATSSPLGAAVAPLVAVGSAAQDVIIGVAREDRWRWISGFMGVGVVGLGVVSEAQAAAELAKHLPSEDCGHIASVLDRVKHTLGCSKTVVDSGRTAHTAQQTCGRLLRAPQPAVVVQLRAIAYAGGEHLRSMVMGWRKDEGLGICEVELQTIENKTIIEEDEPPTPRRKHFEEVEDGWVLLQEDSKELLRQEEIDLLREWNVISFQHPNSKEAKAMGCRVNCCALPA